MLALVLGTLIFVLDGGFSNVGLPTIAREMHANPSTVIWVITAYQVAIITTLLPMAALGEIAGYDRVRLAGFALFTFGSLCCAVSNTILTLTLARIVQGLGAAGLTAVSAALLRSIYPRTLLGRAIGINAMVLAGAAVIAPPIASAILGWTSWRWLFVLNAPFGLAGLAIGFLSFPKGRRLSRRLNVGSTLLNAATFGPIIAGLHTLVRGSRVAALLLLAWGSVSALLLVRRELSADAPLIPFDLLRIRAFALSIYSLVLCITAQAMGFVALAFFLQESLGYTVKQTGPLLAVWPIVNALTSPIAGRLSDRYSAPVLATIGLLIFSTGLGCVAINSRDAPPWDLIWRLTLCGLGFGLFTTPNTRLVLTSSSTDRSGAASGMLAMARTLGLVAGAQGVAICFAVSGVNRGAQSALLVGAGAALAGAIISGFRLLSAKDSGDRVRPSAPS